MLLSSLDRLKIYISAVESGSRSALTEGTANDSELLGWLTTISARIEKYLARSVELTSYTEYFDTTYGRLRYFVNAYPVTTLTSVYEDSTGEYDGSEAAVSNSYVGVDSRSIVLDAPIGHIALKGLRIIYTGGLAAHGVRSTFAIGSVSGTWTADKYVEGSTSGAMGKVVSSTATSIVIANLYGIFIAGETITEQDTEGTKGASDGTAVISSITAQSLAEAYPDIARACEMQIRYMWKHKMDFENSTTSPEGTVRRNPAIIEGELQPEVKNMLATYRRPIIV